MNNGYFVVIELEGALREQLAEVQRTFDPRLAASSPPHVTIIGSSGAGPIPLGTPEQEIRDAIAPIAAETPPLVLEFGAPMRFMQSNVVVLPLDPHGPLRELHERIVRSGLTFARARFTFTPHCTLSFYPTITRDAERQLLATHVDQPVVVRTLKLYRSINPMPYRLAHEFPLGGDREQSA
jgi:2'-5' RNA ligase